MASQNDVTEARLAAQFALLKKIEDGATRGIAAKIVSEWSLAYRYLAGGAQPGSISVEK